MAETNKTCDSGKHWQSDNAFFFRGVCTKKKKVSWRLYCLALFLMIIAGHLSAYAAEKDFTIGVNMVNPQRLKADEQDAILDEMVKNGVKVIRCGIYDDDKGIDFAKRVYARGIKVFLIAGFKYSPDAPTRPYQADKFPVAWSGHPLSYADPQLSGQYFQSLLSKLEAEGVQLSGIELGNEINWACFNAEFPLPGEGKILGLDDLYNDPEGKQIAKGYLRYLEVLKVIKEIRDHSALNQQTPIISAGLADTGPEGPAKLDGVCINATLDFLASHGLDKLVDAYGIHTYPWPRTHDERLSRLEKYAVARCSAAGTTHGKPAWITEWGITNHNVACPPEEGDRPAIITDMMQDFHGLFKSGRLRGLLYFSWNSEPYAKKVEPLSIYRCGQLTESGKIALERSLIVNQRVAPEIENGGIESSHIVLQIPFLQGDSRQHGHLWNEFYHSEVGLLKQNSSYNISFEYKVVGRSPDTQFYSLVRSRNKQAADQGWHQFTSNSGSVQMDIKTDDVKDVYLIIGIKNSGAVQIRNLRVSAVK